MMVIQSGHIMHFVFGFDTGWDPQAALAILAENQLQLRHLFITHSHEDHIAGVATVQKQFPKVNTSAF